MQIKFLESAVRDTRWFREYYNAVFPEGRTNARQSLKNLQGLLKANPFMGQSVEGLKGVRKFPVSRTPFVLIYRVAEDCMEVLRLRDTRRDEND